MVGGHQHPITSISMMCLGDMHDCVVCVPVESVLAILLVVPLHHLHHQQHHPHHHPPPHPITFTTTISSMCLFLHKGCV